MAISPYKTFIAGEVLTAADLNNSFLQIINNASSLVSPLTGSLDADGNNIILDTDADSYINAVTDDTLLIHLGGGDLFTIDASVASPLNGMSMIATATAVNPYILARGETNIGLGIRPKGTGGVIIQDGGGNEVLIGGAATALAVNEVTVTNAATTFGPTIAATGGDTNIDLNINPKGTGIVAVAASTGAGDPIMRLRSSDAGAAGGPTLQLDRASATPAAADVTGIISFTGRDSGAAVQQYAFISATIDDPTAASEDAHLNLGATTGGTSTTRVRIGAGMWSPNATGGAQGSDSLNFSEIYDDGVLLKNGVVQVVETATGAVSTGTTTIPLDDTIPQIGEGTEFLSRAITPTSATNKLLIEINVNVATTANVPIVALFQDAGSNALDAFPIFIPSANVMDSRTRSYVMTAGTTSATTFTVRIGGSGASTITLNGASSARLFGGVAISSLRVTELLPQQ